MAYWLVKSEPEEFSIDDLKQEKVTTWTGVRNFAARKNIQAMKRGDTVFFYHSGSAPAVVGEGRVASAPYPEEDEWTTVNIAFWRHFPRTVSRGELLKHKEFKDSILARQGRLSVQPVTGKEALVIRKLASRAS